MSRILSTFGISGKRPGRRLPRAILGEDDEHRQGQKQRHQGEAEDEVPAPHLGQAGAEERGQGRAAIARPGNSHRQPLILGRIPSAGQRQGGGEAGPRNAQEQAHQQDLAETVGPEPAHEQRDDRQCHAQNAGAPRSDLVRQHAEHQPQHRPAQQGNGNHQALLGVGEAELRDDRIGQRADQDPDHEADIEV